MTRRRLEDRATRRTSAKCGSLRSMQFQSHMRQVGSKDLDRIKLTFKCERYYSSGGARRSTERSPSLWTKGGSVASGASMPLRGRSKSTIWKESKTATYQGSRYLTVSTRD